MKTNELRIGNWVSIENSPVRVAEIRADEYFRYKRKRGKPSGVVRPETLRPIVLSEEWLERLGFERKDCLYHLRYELGYVGVSKHENDTEKGWDVSFGEQHILRYMFVHELQNICFALTRQELQIKEEEYV